MASKNTQAQSTTKRVMATIKRLQQKLFDAKKQRWEEQEGKGRTSRETFERIQRLQRQIGALYTINHRIFTGPQPQQLKPIGSWEIRDPTQEKIAQAILDKDPVIGKKRRNNTRSSHTFNQKAWNRTLTQEEYLTKARQRFQGRKRNGIIQTITTTKQAPKPTVRPYLVRLRRDIKRRLRK